MRRLALLLLLALAACRQRPQAIEIIEEPVEAPTAIRVADPTVESQLLSGFHQIEQGAWRWVAHEFAVSLRGPFLASQRGAVLRLQFTIPDPIRKLGPLTLKASAGGVPLSPERYTEGGKLEYVREVPPSAFASDPVKIEFTTDRFLTPGNADKRELSIVVESVGLEPVRD